MFGSVYSNLKPKSNRNFGNNSISFDWFYQFVSFLHALTTNILNLQNYKIRLSSHTWAHHNVHFKKFGARAQLGRPNLESLYTHKISNTQIMCQIISDR